MEQPRVATANYKDEEATYTEQKPQATRAVALTTARYAYQESAQIWHRGKDVLGRETTGPYDDRRIHPVSGKFVPLKVQSTSAVLNGPGGTTWKRRKIKSVGPLTMRLANWAYARVADDKGSLDVLKSWATALEYFYKALFLVVPMIFMSPFFRMTGGEIVNGGRYTPVPYRYYGRAKKSRNEKDDQIAQPCAGPQRQGPKIPMDSYSDTASVSTTDDDKLKKTGKERLERVLLPRRLCFLDQQPTREIDADTGEMFLEYHSTNVKQWMEHNNQGCPEYLFVAWNGRQFPTAEDCERLHELARYATREAGLQCYWISLECMAQEDEGGLSQMALDVWRISDIIRGSKKLVVMLRTPQPGESIEALLRQWGESIWTFPELLLSPGRRMTTYHYSGEKQVVRTVVPKNQFSARCLATDDDRYQVRRLLDHYLGNLKLSDLELMTVALHCFSSRKAGSLFLAGDYSYALMGLLGHRPQISASDSAFLAFARLSLENYNSRLFERFVCLLPAEQGQAWHKTQDAFGAQLWDIEPSVQVAGIGVYDQNSIEMPEEVFEKEYFLKAGCGGGDDDDDDTTLDGLKSAGLSSRVTEISTPNQSVMDVHRPASGAREMRKPSHSELREDDVVILDGCHAAMVHWKQFQPVWHAKKLSFRRKLLKWLLRLNFVPFLIGIILAALSRSALTTAMPSFSDFNRPSSSAQSNSSRSNKNSDMEAAGAVFLVYSLIVYLAAPLIVRTVYGGKFWETQPWFFGFEGYMPIDEIEAKIFGVRKGRLMWSPYASSTLSHHEIKDNRWVVPRDPRDDPATARLVEKAQAAVPGDMRVFTIVDTYSMTATLFEARRPPEALLVCGSEGGMQRALGCSFEWTTSTFYKETVIRIETRALQRMDRIPRVRLGIQRLEKPTVRR
jgi:hypothetical protein